MDAEELYYAVTDYVKRDLCFHVPDDADEALVRACELIAGAAKATIEETDEIDVAPGFTLHLETEIFDEPRWTLTGCLPSEDRAGDHYELEDALVKAGLLTRAQCDSESGQFFAYPDSEEQGRACGVFIETRLRSLTQPVPSIWAVV